MSAAAGSDILDPEAVLLLRRLMGAARQKSSDIGEQLHPAWIYAAWQRIGFSGRPLVPGVMRRCSPALASVYGLRFESMARFSHRPHRIALLPRSEMMKVLAAVALHADRERVRRCISRSLRAAIVECIGEPAYVGLLDAPPLKRAPEGALEMDDLQPERLALDGYAVLNESGAWRCKSTLAWVQLALPPVAIPATSRTRNGQSDPDPVLDRLSQFFPEHVWLFGSPMDRALSV